MSHNFFIKSNPAGKLQILIVNELRRLRIPFTVIGGVAISAYRQARYTEDIDIVITPPKGGLGPLVDHLVRIIPGAHREDLSFTRGQRFYRIALRRGRKKKIVVADIAPSTLYPQYEAAHAVPRLTTVQDYEGYGRIHIPGKEELIAMKVRSALSPYRLYHKKAQDEVDIIHILPGANLTKVGALVQDVHGRATTGEVLSGPDYVRLLVQRMGGPRPNPPYTARAVQDAIDRNDYLPVPPVPRAAGRRCPACGRVVRVVRGRRIKAHDFRYRRCPGSGALA